MSETAGRYTLKFPIPAGDVGEQLNEITVRRMLAGDLRAMDVGKTEMDKAALLMARLTGLSAASIDAMDVSDFTAVSAMIADQQEATV